MNPDDLRAEVETELAFIQQTMVLLGELLERIGESTPDNHELAAVGAYLANFYSGIENILKRIARYFQIEMPSGPNWHVQLLQIFGPEASFGAPQLFDNDLLDRLDPYRSFRHVFFHGYAIALRWERLRPNAQEAPKTFSIIRAKVLSMIEKL